VATMCRVLQRLNLPRKKHPFTPLTATHPRSNRPGPPTHPGPPPAISGA
jgi:hypothetical protein